MQRAILAVSPNLQFLEQIRSHLEEGGRYRVQGVTSSSDALALVKDAYFDLAILDAESSDVPFVPFTRDLVALQPGLKLLVFPPANNPHHPVLAGLVTNGFLKKPFFTPEVSRAFKEIFSEKPEKNQTESQPITNLAELWMKRPEVSFNRVEQLLGSTTAQTGLLIGRGNVIAASGAVDDAVIQQVLKILEVNPPERASQDLIQFLSIQDEEGILLYASQLIPEITLVLFYSPSTSIQLARQEVFQVKNEFKEAFPNTRELRKELADKAENIVPEAPLEPEVEEIITEDIPIEEAETDESALKPLEDEIGFEDLDTVLSSAELKNLDAMLSKMPSPDPGVAESEEHSEPEPIKDLDLTDWLPLPEDFKQVDENIAGGEEKTLENQFNAAAVEPEITTPALPDELLEQFRSSEQEEDKIPEDFSFEKPQESIFEEPLVQEAATQTSTEASQNEPASDEFDFNKIWGDQIDTTQPVSEIAAEEITGNTASEFFNPEALIEDEQVVEPQMPTEPVTDEVNENDFSTWLDELLEKEPSTTEALQENKPADTPLPPPLPGFEPVWQNTESEFQPIIEETEVETPIVQNLDEVDLIPTSVESELEELDEQIPLAPENNSEKLEYHDSAYSSGLVSETGTTPLGIHNFRFHYSCLLIPRNPKQFLTGDISERLSFILPQLHLEHGWRITGISIRPHYMLWSISVPMDTCPIDIIQEIRRRTSTHLYSNFPDLGTEENKADYWAPGFLALSGSSGPTTGMIYDFIKAIRDNQKSSN